ncbi:hypothetical protein KEM52_001779, partial [Ascosphaera acerosa]
MPGVTGFEPNAIIRGAQLTVVGALRALQNPALFKSSHYRQALIACCAGVAVEFLLFVPVLLAKAVLLVPWLLTGSRPEWDHVLYDWLRFFSDAVLQVPFLVMTLLGHITPTLDDLFMESLRWADATYLAKHAGEDPATLRPAYHPNLAAWPANARRSGARSTAETQTSGGSGGGERVPAQAKVAAVLRRSARRTALSVGVYALSHAPHVGKYVYPAASYWAFRQEVGDLPAGVLFAAGLVLPKRWMVLFFQSYYSSRSLMRELLRPYFKRIHFTPDQKRRWFFARQGVLFGFALGFYFLLRVPFVGVLMYGVAQASTAYLLTKITDPPPAPPAALAAAGGAGLGSAAAETEFFAMHRREGRGAVVRDPAAVSWTAAEFAESQTTWRSKKAFLALPALFASYHKTYC